MNRNVVSRDATKVIFGYSKVWGVLYINIFMPDPYGVGKENEVPYIMMLADSLGQ